MPKTEILVGECLEVENDTNTASKCWYETPAKSDIHLHTEDVRNSYSTAMAKLTNLTTTAQTKKNLSGKIAWRWPA